MLADAAGEHDGIHAAHGCNVAADGLLDLVVQHVAGQLCALVAFLSSLFHIALVAGNAGNTQQAGLLVEDLVQLMAGDAQRVLQIVDHGGVQVTAAGAHHQTGQRGHAHGGVHHAALVHRGDGGAVAQMAGDELQTGDRLGQILGGLHAHVLVAGAVEAVAAHAVLLIILVGDGVHIRLGGHGGMEGGVKHGHIGQVAEHLLGGLDAHDGGRVVQGGQRAQVTDGLYHLIGDEAALLELLAAVYDAVTNGVNLADAVNDLAFAGGHLLHHFSKRLGVGGEDGGGRGLVTIALMGDHAALHADALAQTLAQHLGAVHVDELVLQAGRATVDNQDFHWKYPPLVFQGGPPFLIHTFII